MTVFGHIKSAFDAGDAPPAGFLCTFYMAEDGHIYNISTCFVHIQTIRYMAVFGHIKSAFLSWEGAIQR